MLYGCLEAARTRLSEVRYDLQARKDGYYALVAAIRPGTQMVEIAAIAGLDFVVLDAEHAPFSATDIDHGVLAGRASGIAVLVRVPDHVGPWIQQAIDVGADGVMVPHVSSVGIAEAVVRAARFAGGARGYSNSPRAGGYGTATMTDHLVLEDEHVTVIVQIEDRAGVDAADRIGAVPGVDAIFIGPADLAVAYGASGPGDQRVKDIVGQVAKSATRQGLAWGCFASSRSATEGDRGGFRIIGSDQSALRDRWRDIVNGYTSQ